MKMYTRLLLIAVGCMLYVCACSKKNDVSPSVPSYDSTGTQVQPDFTAGANLWAGANVCFTINRKVTTARWDFGDGTPEIYTGPGLYCHVFAAGTYTVTLTVDDDTTQRIAKAITIRPYYQFSYAGDSVAGDTLWFTSSTYPSSGNTYAWTFGDGTASAEAHPWHVYASPGTYTVRLVVNNEESYACTRKVIINRDPLYTHLVAGIRVLHDCQLVTRPAGWPEYTTYYPDSTMNFQYINKLTLKLNLNTYFFNEAQSHGNILRFDKQAYYGNELMFNENYPGTLTYYIAEDSISYRNVTAGILHGSSPGSIFDYTFTAHAP